MMPAWIHLRRTALALGTAGALGFGATQALAAPGQAMFRACTWSPYGPQLDPYCDEQCRAQNYDWGYCNGGQCICSMLGPPA